MDVRMPDGTVISNVPEGVTKAQLLAKYGKMKESPYGPTKMAEMSSVPDDFNIPGAADEEPGLLSRLFNPPGGIGEVGPAPLTSEEGKSALGILGATVGTAIAPQLTVPAMLSKAKFLGPVASFFTKNAAKAGASGIGGATGETVADVAQGNDVELGEVAQTAGEYAGAELVGAGIGKAAEKALAPAANVVTDQAKKLLAFAKKENIPISAGVLVPGMTEKIIQGSTDNFIPSRLVNQHYRGKLITRMNELMGEIPEGVGQVLGKEESSLITTESFRAASNAKQATAKRLREDFLETVGRDTVVPVKNTEALLNKISPQVKDQALREFIEVELASITKGTKTADQLEQTLNQIGAVRAKGADKKYLTQIREAAQEDFKAVGADMEKLSNSSNFFKMNSELLSNPVARRLMKENLTSQQMTAQIFRAGNESFIKQLGKELPPETWNSLKAQNLANLLENFSEQSDKLPGARILNKGDQLVKWIENNKTVLKEAYDPGTIEALENFAQLAKASKGEAANYGKDLSNFSSLLNVGGMGGGFYAEPTTLVVSTPALMWVSKSMMDPNGVIKQWLTTGIKGGKEIGDAAKLTGRAAVAGEEE
jgi:hypothetical protein